MKITTQQYNNIRCNVPNKQHKLGIADRTPSCEDKINFTSKLVSKATNEIIEIAKKGKNIEISNAQKLVPELDNLFGNKYFSQKLTEIGVDSTKDKLIITNRSFIKDELIPTIRFPIYDLPCRLANSLCDLFKIENKPNFVKNWIKNAEIEKSKNFIIDTIEEFSNSKYKSRKNPVNKFDLNLHLTKFKDKVGNNVTKVDKGYATRDERTLNRVATSIVSAVYAANDFHNISMLQKDNETEAKKSGRKRLKQELTRMGFDAVFTFSALGMLDRYTKKNIVANSLVIAGSALASQIFSRKISDTPLTWLSPEQAAKIAQKRKAKKETKAPIEQDKKNNVSFKSKLKDQNAIFGNFVSKDGTFKALNIQNSQIANEIKTATETKPKKKIGIGKILASAFGIASVAFFGSKILKGDYKNIQRKKELIDEVKKIIPDENVSFDNLKELMNNKTLSKNITDASKKIDDASDKYSFSQWKKKLTHKKINITPNSNTKDFTLDTLQSRLEGFKNNTTLNIETKALLEKYISDIEETKATLIGKDNKIKNYNISVERFGIAGIVNGLTKICETIYDILTLPAKAISGIIDSLNGNREINKEFKTITSVAQLNNNARHKKEITELYQLFNEKSLLTRKTKTDAQILEAIKKRARNVEISSETGDLANMSRTMVTGIGTYFFVNDYRNNVLIESEGKDIQGAKEEMTDRIWHKVFNFVFNGTLMNLFNNTFKTVLNKSLLGAATVATATEMTNEFLIRKSLCQPVLPQKSKQDIIDFENEQINKKGPMGTWSRFFRKLTGKKTLTQKAGINKIEQK